MPNYGHSGKQLIAGGCKYILVQNGKGGFSARDIKWALQRLFKDDLDAMYCADYIFGWWDNGEIKLTNWYDIHDIENYKKQMNKGAAYFLLQKDKS